MITIITFPVNFKLTSLKNLKLVPEIHKIYELLILKIQRLKPRDEGHTSSSSSLSL